MHSPQPVVLASPPVDTAALPTAVFSSFLPDGPPLPSQLSTRQRRRRRPLAPEPAAKPGLTSVLPPCGPETEALRAQATRLEGLVTDLSAQVATLTATVASLH